MEELLTKLAELDISLEARGAELDIYDPRRALTDELLSVIKTNKSGLLALLKEVGTVYKFDSIPAAGLKEYYTLSYAQKKLYFLYEFDRVSVAYNMPRVIRLEGKLDQDRLNATFHRLITRHESLRTFFEVTEDGPMQKISPRVEFAIEHLRLDKKNAPGRDGDHLQGPDKEDIEVAIRGFIRPFDLSRAPLLRAGLIMTGNEEHLLILDMYHIIADAISQNILINDFIALYAGEELPGLKLQFRDYSEWQQSPAHRDEVARQRDFWINEFAGEINPLDLPADFPRPPMLRYAGHSLRFEIGEEETERLKAIAGVGGATLFMTLLSAYAIFLSKISNREDIVIGSPTTARHYPGLENIVGMFVNTLPLRIRPESTLEFREFLSHVRSKTLSCMDNQDYQYEELIEVLHIERDTSRNPLFDVLFDFANYEQTAITIPGLTIKPFDIHHEVAKFDLSLSAILVEDRILLNFEYSTSLFRQDTIERFIGYFRQVISSVTNNPDIAIGEIGILSEKERQLLLVGFNNTGMPFGSEETIVSLFERKVLDTPDKIAIVFENEKLTYRELNERSNRVAHYLRRHFAIQPDKVIGIMIERSGAMMIGLLGILKSGAAYLPIDPAYPGERVEYILSDSGAGILLVGRAFRGPLAYSGEILPLDKIIHDGDRITTDFANPGSVIGSTDLCYLIYTSGSTGKPKGVMISHRNVMNFMAGLSRQLPLRGDDCMLAVTSTSFDISVLELFWTLCQGIEVVIHPSDISMSNLDRYVPAEILPVDFSLLFFSSYDNREKDKYRLLLESVRYADKEGFKAVWTPERHFHEFGGLYPNPSVTSAALAMITERIALRSGSVVSPLHDPVRIAEEWSVVDNLSGGRVAISFAPGWNPNDFAINGANFKNRQKDMYDQIDTIRKLWKGESIRRTNGLDKEVEVRIFPGPVQAELPIWVTSGGTEETFRQAGAIGANILTHLLGQDLEDLSRKITLYRESRAAHGHARKGIVTIMLHTYIGESIPEVERVVEQPFIEYLKISVGLTKLLNEETGVDEENIGEEKKALILKNAFLRYYKAGSLIGTRATCSEMIRKLSAAGIDEVACLIDFGIDRDQVLEGLKYLNELKQMFTPKSERLHSPVTMMQSTPSFIKLAQEGAGSQQFLRSLRMLLLGGEAVPISLVRRLKRDTHADIFNMYGPTETTIWSCMHEFEKELEKVLIGKPMGNTQIYILNERLQLVPPGVAGDLYIGGKGLSRGYWKRPELTAERFIVNPYSKVANPTNKAANPNNKIAKPDGKEDRIYKTGDIARWLPDGTIELLGREDHQVKIRGYRIEAGEIENLLSAYEGIHEAVVIPREMNGDKFLVAYYVTGKGFGMPGKESDVTGKELGADELRRYLAERLPEYMIPSYFMHLPAMPLTPNGKINRKELPAPDRMAGSDYEAPSNDIEEQLTGLWSEVLKIDKIRISVTADFFRMGGHSLNAMIVVGRIEKRFGRAIPLKIFYGNSTIRGIAGFINSTRVPLPGERAPNGAILPSPRKKYYPLSSQQKRMYFLHELDRTSLAYNESGIYELKGDLDAKRLSGAFERLIERHEILRTSFNWEGEEPVQQITDSADFYLEFIQADKEHDEERIIRDFIRPFDLHTSPLLRVGIIKLASDEHLLIVDMHHIITDGVSKGILVNDFMALYKQEELPAPALHYKDYVEWLLEEKQRQKTEKQRAFWLEQFATEIPVHDLPADFVRPAVRTYAGSVKGFALGEAETAQLRSIAGEERTTLYMVLLAIYNIFLGKLGNQDDVIIGTPTAGRQHADLEKMMGMFVNTLPLRNYPHGDLSFREFLGDVKARTLECFDNQAYPYEELIDELKPTRAPGRNPLFDALFVFHNFERFELKIPGLALKNYDRKYNISKFDITLEVFESEDRVLLNVEYSTELFSLETIERFIACFGRVVDDVITNPNKKISGINIISRQEEQRLLHEFNDTAAPYPAGETILSIFEKQVQKDPENIALRYEGYTVSYRRLKELTDKIAGYLQEVKGIRTGDLVGLMLERDEYLIPSVFGILKAGGVYVPIDPKYPRERIEAILSDSKINILITRTGYRHLLPDMAPGRIELDKDGIILLEEDWSDIVSHAAAPSVIKATGKDLAYVIYTSGSTGKPKGVMIAHHSVINRLFWMQKEYPIGPEDVLLQKTPVVFDVSVWELFWWSFTGASLCLLGPGDEKEPQKIIHAIRGHGVTVIHFVPSMLSAFLAPIADKQSEELAGRPGLKDLHSLRLVFTSGEVLKAEQADLFGKTLNDTCHSRLINLYGPTEATVDVSFYECSFAKIPRSIPIGKPIDNTRLYILDRNHRLAPLGVPGELCIAGEGLARGYLNNPELTAQKFVDSDIVPRERLYRTGDLAKWMPDGNITFLGRLDDQVKIRGFRIELEEIEGQLMRQGMITEAAVIAKENQEEKFLIAYYVSGSPLEAEELRNYLSGKLPGYMIPAYYVHLTGLPVTSSGKLNRKALPDPDITAGACYNAPAGDIEEKLAEIWAEVLKLEKEKISVTSSFFGLGGHSLKALRVIDKIRMVFSVEIGLRMIFEHVTIRQLAGLIEGYGIDKGTKIKPVDLVAKIPSIGRKEYYITSSAQERLFLEQMMNEDRVKANISLAYEIKGELDRARIEYSFRLLLSRHESLRTWFTLSGDDIVQSIDDSTEFALIILDPGKYKTANEVFHDFVRPFDLSRPPLIRCGLLEHPVLGNILFVDIHHIICDGISLNILMNDFMSACKGILLPAPELRYVDYAYWQKERADSLKKEKEFWKGRLAGPLPRIELPVLRDRATVDIYQAAARVLEISGDRYHQIKTFTAAANVSDFMFLLSIYYLLISRVSGNTDIIVGTDAMGRTAPELKNIVGTFVNVLPLRLRVPGKIPYEAFLSDVKACVLEAFDHQAYPYDLMSSLSDACRGQKIVEVYFAYRGFLESAADLGELQFVSLPPEGQLNTARYELELDVEQSEDHLNITFLYSTALYDEQTIGLFMAYYSNMIAAVLDDPSIYIEKVHLKANLS